MKINNNDFEKFELKVLFYREGKKYYFDFKKQKYECNRENINKLKEQLVVPYKIKFYGMSRAQLGKVLSDLLDKTIDVKFKKLKNEEDTVFRFEAIFFEKKRNNSRETEKRESISKKNRDR